MGVIVTITEQSGNDLVDYQVRVEITDPQFFEECPDQKYIECYFQDGSWIPHWVEEFDPANNKAVIWVKVPQIPANGTVKVFIKVNPSRTEDLSNGEAVFEFFDDFETDTIASGKWTVLDGEWGISDGKLSLYLSANEQYNKRIYATGLNLDRNIAIETKWMMTTGLASGIISQFDVGKDNYYLTRHEGADYNTFKIIRFDSGTPTELVGISKTYQNNKWYITVVKVTSDKIIANDGEDEIQAVDTTYLSGTIGLFGQAARFSHAPGYIYFDWIIVRKYIEPEPTVTVEYVPETVTYTDYFYWGMAKMLSGAIANLMQLPIKMEIYSGGNLLKTLSLKEISTITDAENKYIISVLKFEDNSSDSYQTDKQIVYVTDPNGNLRKLAESTYVFIKMAELPLLLGFEIRMPYEDTQVELS